LLFLFCLPILAGMKTRTRLLLGLASLFVAMLVCDRPAGAQGPALQRQTRVEIRDTRWFINGAVTYPGAPAEGLLMNVRMVNSLFEDRHRPDFDAESNTDEFLAALPQYVAAGMRAFTICLQGGMPGYEGALNSAFESDGSLRESYLSRAARVIEACDARGAVVILGCYYQRQDQVLKDEEAVRRGVANVSGWLKERGYTNVLLEIANEHNHGGFDHEILHSPAGQVELIRLAKRTHPDLLASTSGLGDGRLDEPICEAADFVLIHFNGVSLDDIPDRIAAMKRFGKPIVCNEDDKLGETAARAAELSVSSGASWGFMHERHNQHHPFRFEGPADDRDVYRAVSGLTGNRSD
jgi:hypothetical protein